MTKSLSVFAHYLIAVFLVVTVFCSLSAAQTLPPPLSPWLSMFNNNRGGALSNYHTFVRPQQEIMKEFQTQERQIQAQRNSQQDLQGEVDKVLSQPRKKVGFATNRAAGYGQYLHYYNGMPGRPMTNYGYNRRRY